MRLHANVIITKRARVGSVLFASITLASNAVPDTQQIAKKNSFLLLEKLCFWKLVVWENVHNIDLCEANQGINKELFI